MFCLCYFAGHVVMARGVIKLLGVFDHTVIHQYKFVQLLETVFAVLFADGLLKLLYRVTLKIFNLHQEQLSRLVNVSTFCELSKTLAIMCCLMLIYYNLHTEVHKCLPYLVYFSTCVLFAALIVKCVLFRYASCPSVLQVCWSYNGTKNLLLH